jgi:hypothetical protein
MDLSTVFSDADQPSEKTVSSNRLWLEEDGRWQVARRVTASKGFVRSKYLTSFILYICEKHLLDRTSEITEQQIGEHVFLRPRGYNPGEDNIVRNYARLLRQRLEEYFTKEGASERIRIVVPRGGYVPLFVEEDAPVGKNRSNADDTESPSLACPAPWNNTSTLEPITVVRSSWMLKALCAISFATLLFVSLHDIRIRQRPTITDHFWQLLFSPSRDTLLVPADSGLVIYQNLTKRRISLAEYAAGEYQKRTLSTRGIDSATVNELGGRRYTSVVDLHLVSLLSQLPAVVKNRFRVRYAREVTLDDLKQSNVILLGSKDSNPWVELFQKNLDFQFEFPNDSNDAVIHNLHPMAGEKTFYETDQKDPARTTFGVIALAPNLDGTGHVLLIEGINMAGTEAAGDYLFSDAFATLLHQISDSKGNMIPFEVLLATSNIGANAPQPLIVAQRIGRIAAQEIRTIH